MTIIEKQLELKAAESADAKRFLTQWNAAKEYVPQVLNTISHYFPHYSLHDASHSETILNNIVMVLGEDVIMKLSVVDLWLLLSAAYYHDLGMAVTADDKMEILKDGSEFVEYIKTKLEHPEGEMYKYASCYEIRDNKVYCKEEPLTIKNLDAQRFLIADFMRSRHGSRSKDIILNSSYLRLPGNVIPERIMKILAAICHSHMQSQEDVMLLEPVENSGCGTELCHPRFVACMLRLGDLLDVDTNRVSSVLLGTLTDIPADSLLYNQTNRDITHIRISKSVIEITARCNDYKVAKILNNWFKWIDEELAFQSRNWYQIAPSPDLGSLPSAGQLIVKHKDYEDINGKNSLRFVLDNTKAMELLQGAGLYSTASQSIREVLQNAVDATYLRIFQENPKLSERKDFLTLCKKRPISIVFNKTKTDDDYTYWKLIIQDEGIGMDDDDLKYLSHTGSSNQNKAKNATISRMPEWMRPSGTFGIGFQSIFLITDKVNLRTRKWGSDKIIDLDLYNPSGEEKGAILKRTYKDTSIPMGTRLECDMKFSRHPKWHINASDRVASEMISNYDFARDESLDVEAAQIIDEIERFSFLSYLDLSLELNGDDILFEAHNDGAYDFYDDETCMEVSMRSRYGISSLFYRNQYVSKFNPHLPLLLFSVNILSGDAKDILEISRNDVKREKIYEVRERCVKAVLRYIIKKYDAFDKTISSPHYKLKPYAAAILEMYAEYMQKYMEGIVVPTHNEWKQIEIVGVDSKGMEISKKISALLEFKKVEYIESLESELRFYSRTSHKKPTFRVGINSFRVDNEIFNFLLGILHKKYSYLKYKEDCILFSTEDTGSFIDDTMGAKKKLLLSYLTKGTYARGYIPCPQGYDELKLKDAIDDELYQTYGIEHYIILSPYIRVKNSSKDKRYHSLGELQYCVDDSVINYVYKNRADDNITKRQIEEAYERFKEEFQPIVDEINKTNGKKIK